MISSKLSLTALSGVLAAALFGGARVAAQQNDDGIRMMDSMRELPAGLGRLPELSVPANNPQSELKAELGRRLFFDARLSGSGQMSCATCHDPKHGFSDGRPRAVGSHGNLLPRHTPTIFNAAYNNRQFWDGRAGSLEQQIIEPLTSNKEMSMTDEGALISRLRADPKYRSMFTAVFGEEPRMLNISMALAAYERTVISGDSRFDRYAKGDKGALTKEEKQGLVLFVGKARCARCHSGPNFTDNNFHSIGINNGDDGRFLVSHAEDDRAAFKTPGLRNVAMHPPYMHDGSLSSLADVIDYYDRGGNAGKTKSPFIYRIGLTPSEKRELLEFLRALSGENGQQKQ